MAGSLVHALFGWCQLEGAEGAKGDEGGRYAPGGTREDEGGRGAAGDMGGMMMGGEARGGA